MNATNHHVEIPGRFSDTRLRSATFALDPDGTRFLAVDGPDGQRYWCATEPWTATPELVHHDLVALAEALGATHLFSDDYGLELCWETVSGRRLLICPTGGHLRIETSDADELYWVADEFADDPLLVAGAVIGALCP